MLEKLRNIGTNIGKAVETATNPRTLHVFAIKDIRADEFNTPFFQPTHAHAVRVFKMEVNRQDSQNLINLYPEDFELWYLGEFRQADGNLSPELQLIVKGTQLKNP